MQQAVETNRFRQKLLKNTGAIIGLCIIVLAVFIALTCYQLAPDASPFGNRMIPAIGSKSPGFSMHFLLIKQSSNKEASILSKWISGVKDTVQYIPIQAYQQRGDTIYYEQYIDEGLTKAGSIGIGQLAQPTALEQKFYLGTDKFGRDMLSRLLIGTRVSLSVGLIAVLISLIIGISLGAMAGYFRGWIDEVIMWLINVIWSIPTLLLVFAMTLLLGKGFWQVFMAVGLSMWVNVARLVRGQVMAVRELEYIEATRVLGFSHSRTIIKHILPNIMGPVLVIAASNFASAIVLEAGLSFLGVGVQPPQPSWGLMIKENYNFIITNNPALALAPGIAIMLLVLAFNLLGNGLRDAFAVKD